MGGEKRRLRSNRVRAERARRATDVAQSTSPDPIGASLWRTFRAVVVSPHQAMVGLAADARAGRKGILLLVIVELVGVGVVVVRGQLDPPMGRVWVGPALAVATVAVSALILWLASASGGYASAFGRLSFAFEVPSVLVGLPLAVATAVMLSWGEAIHGEWFSWLETGLSVAASIWTLALVAFAVRASVTGRARVGCTALLIVGVSSAVVLVAGVLLVQLGWA